MSLIHIDTLFYLVANLFGVYVRMGFVNIFFGEQKQATRIRTFLFVAFYLVNSGLHLAFQNPLVNLCTNIGFILLLTCTYDSNLGLKAVATILTMAVSMAADQLVYFVLEDLGFVENLATITNISSNILIFIMVLILKRFTAKSFYGFLRWTQLVMILVIPVGSIIIMALVFFFVEEVGVVFVITAILLVMDVMVFYFYDTLVKHCADKQKQYHLEFQNAAYVHEFEVISQSDDKIRRIRHDLVNHLFTLQKLVDINENEKARKYIQELHDFAENKSRFAATGNHEIDSVLNYKLQKAVELNAKISVQLAIPEALHISPLDMNIILGNLLDNALEAMKGCEEKQLKILMSLEPTHLRIVISNTFKNQIRQENNRFITNKTNRENHGIGLENVKSVVEKYCGNFEVNIDKDIFTVEISMLNEGS